MGIDRAEMIPLPRAARDRKPNAAAGFAIRMAGARDDEREG